MSLSDTDREQLEGFGRALREHQGRLEAEADRPKPMGVRVGSEPVQVLAALVAEIESAFPGLVPTFDPDDLGPFRSLKGRPFYENARVRDYLANAISAVERKIRDPH